MVDLERGEQPPDVLVLDFLNTLPPKLRRSMFEAIARAFGRGPAATVDAVLEAFVHEILRPPQKWLMHQRVVLVVGFIDHQINNFPGETRMQAPNDQEEHQVRSIEQGWHRQAEARWRKLRSGPLSATALLDFEIGG